jgi:hypothetical protein
LTNDANPEQAEPGDDEESTVGPLSGDGRTEQPIGLAGDDRESITAAVADSDGGYSGPAGDPDLAAVHEHSDDRNIPFGGNTTEYEEVVTTNEDYDAGCNESDQTNDRGETVAIEGDAGDGEWETSAPDAQREGPEHLEDQDDAEAIDTREQSCFRVVFADHLNPPFIDSGTIDLTAPMPDHDHIIEQQGIWHFSTTTSASSNLTTDADTDSIGQRTLDEFSDAQEENRADFPLHEGEESNSTTGKC